MRLTLTLTMILALMACAGGDVPVPEQVARPMPTATPIPAGKLVIFLGDSLTAGLGVAADETFPALIDAHLKRSSQQVRVVNAGVSGDTTAGGLRRIDWLLGQRPELMVIALGANDGMRGLNLEAAEANLAAILEACAEGGVEAVLVGIKIPTSMGPDYTARFDEIFPRLAKRYDVLFVPFLLENVATIPELNQADGIHPNAAGYEIIAKTVLPTVLQALEGPLHFESAQFSAAF